MTTTSLVLQTQDLVDNWTTPYGLQNGIFIMQHWEEEKEQLREKLLLLQPAVFFISTFAMNFPGAIAVATMVREICPHTLIVLGGCHPSETFYRDIDTKKGEW